MAMSLRDGLRADPSSRIAFAGAGGKTTAMFSLARQLPGLVVCLNTAHLAVEQAQLADHYVVVLSMEAVREAFEMHKNGVLLFSGPEAEGGRLTAVSELAALEINNFADFYHVPVLIEADGSRMLPLKAPAGHEPPIPGWVNHVVYMIGLSALGKPLTSENVFRAEIFSDLIGAESGKPVDLERLVRYAQHPLGGLKNIPVGARRTLFANQLDACDVPREQVFDHLKTLSPVYDAILAGSLRQPATPIAWRHERVAGIVLAAGRSKRMGEIKQLLLWQGKPLVWHSAKAAIDAGLDPVLIVTGHAAEQVEQALAGLPVKVVFNPDWESGQASSIRAGVGALPAECGGAVFLLSDMPQVPAELIKAELEIHRREAVPIICPRVDGQRTNPVLFDRQTFVSLLELTGDSGGRGLFDRIPIHWLEWDDPAVLKDIDTPEDYQSLVEGGENGS